MLQGFNAYHVIVLMVVVAPFVLWVIALVQIAASKAAGGTMAAWILITTLVPLVGSILWFAVGREIANRGTRDQLS